MVPPANRRPGYSRRAQYGNFLGYLIAFIGLAVGVGVLLISTLMVLLIGFAADVVQRLIDPRLRETGAGR